MLWTSKKNAITCVLVGFLGKSERVKSMLFCAIFQHWDEIFDNIFLSALESFLCSILSYTSSISQEVIQSNLSGGLHCCCNMNNPSAKKFLSTALMWPDLHVRRNIPSNHAISFTTWHCSSYLICHATKWICIHYKNIPKHSFSQ